MREILFLFWFLAFFLSVVLTLEIPTPTTDWYNSSPDDVHQKESLAHGWFKYPFGHWERKFQYGCSSTSPPAEPSLVRPYASFYLLTSMFRRFAYLGHLRHLAMITVPIGSVIAGLNLGALAHQLRNLFPVKWVPDIPGFGVIIKYNESFSNPEVFMEFCLGELALDGVYSSGWILVISTFEFLRGCATSTLGHVC
ncbi:hypothetical protein DSO57_1013179 [Entomophthora muscae]|uniref:Uncharacterized protein n=1 Tax=Entomophthora muscae TaxID=34485 RepID=A0ACC2US54_9FUNG|nr:hypothetical protein DSO57_1013179 [Entomophthora muscae]